jgi:hypothetical protein
MLRLCWLALQAVTIASPMGRTPTKAASGRNAVATSDLILRHFLSRTFYTSYKYFCVSIKEYDTSCREASCAEKANSRRNLKA